MILSLFVVWIVWPLRGTIAARNIALVSGAIASIAWLRMERPKFALMDLLPIGFLLCVPAWLMGLYIFKPEVPNLQWDDLRGTWLRVIIAAIFAIGLGKLYICRSKIRQFFFWILFIWPIVVLFLFINQGLFTHSWFGEQVYIYVFKSKVAGIYFLIWSLLLCFAIVHRCYFKENNLNEPSRSITLALTMLFVICIVDFFSLQSLNGFIGILLSLIFISFLAVKKSIVPTSDVKRFLRAGFIWIGISAFILAVLIFDGKYSRGKINNIITDIQFIVNEDTTGAWKFNGIYKGVFSTTNSEGVYKGIYPPINTISGKQVNGSTYERVTWSMEGLRFLRSNPWGLGYTGQAFSYYMAQTYPGSQATKTHSGWLDFSLGAGIPGLISVWTALGIIFYRSKIYMSVFQKSHPIHEYICWSIAILSLLWLLAEFSDREFIEHFFFMLAFFSIVVGIQNSPIPRGQNFNFVKV